MEVIPFLRSSDEIGDLPLSQKALLPISPIYGRAAQQDLSRILDEYRPDVLHLHNPYPLLSPWVVRTAHRHGVPVVQTVHNYRQVCSSGLYFRDGHNCHDCRGKAFGWPAVEHKCYRGSAAQSAADGVGAGRAPGHVEVGGPVRRADRPDRRPPDRLRHRRGPDRDQAERRARSG